MPSNSGFRHQFFIPTFAVWLLACIGALMPAAAQNTPASLPRCTGPVECEILWSEAQKAVELVSNMRIRLLTDSRIETYAPIRHSTIGAVVTKTPLGAGVYEIAIQIECYRSTPCDDLQHSGEMLFYTLLQSSKVGKKPVASTPQEAVLMQGKLGVDVLQAERKLKELGCNNAPSITMPAKGPGYEIYLSSCANGDTIVMRCEYGNCRPLR